MKHPARILAGTALGLLMASSPSIAETPATIAAPLVLAQADDAEARKLEEERAAREAAEAEPAPAEEEQAPAEEAAPAAEPEAPAAEPAEQGAPTEAEAPTPEPAPAEERAPVEEAAPADDAAPEAAEEPAAAEEAAPEAAEEPAAAEEAAPEAAEEPAARPRARENRANGETGDNRGSRAERENRANRDAAGQEPAVEGDAEATPPADAPRNAERPAAPADDAAPEAQAADEEALPENAAPVLDSAKEPAGRNGDNRQANRPDRNRGDAAQAPVEDAGPAPTSDEDAQAPGTRAEDIGSITATEGRRMDRDEVRRERSERRERRGRPEGSEVVRETEGRVVIQFGSELFVESNELPRLSRDARDVYYEELPNGRVRETIVRPNGAQIVTLRNRHGEIVRRSRITPEGREIVLSYVAEENWDRERDWRDPGEELPPLRLNIPVREYILDAGRVNDDDSYYDFLDQPPVERARRLYSVDEVKRSARLRDTVRRVDLDTITFATGSAEIARSEVEELDGIANAMLRLLEENPAETFLIEGHTDSVGSDPANLALSDARAESAADVLTQAYGIPPENLVTQGYGERYLKISTEGPVRENRRVAIRRITALVAPVASAQ